MLQLPAFDVAFARAQFANLEQPWALFENAGGTIVPNQVVDRLTGYMRDCQVQPAGPYAPSEEAAERIRTAQRLMEEMMGAETGEVMVGPSTTMNVYLLAQALRPWFAEGDEVVVTNLDHEANSGAWRRLAEFGVTVREWRVAPDTAELEIGALENLLSERTRLVCFTHCSNIAGGFNDVAAITRLVHDAGALVCVDGVAFAPHRQLDVKAWDVDFYLCSPYKIYGPHLGLLYGKRELLLRARAQNHYFISESEVPLKLNPGGPNHELTAALTGIVDYFKTLHRHHFGESNLPLHGRLGQLYALFAEHEERIAAPFVDFLTADPAIQMIGRRTADQQQRAPTFSFLVAGRDSDEIPAALATRGIGIGSGDFYAARLIDALGVRDRGGVVRASMVHYNTADEVERLIAALTELL
ncbi:MAG: aminotransferase class V-fold PLP-dependent enzyme [Alphaproteobacteria bacterium]|nr:aminotransferase class V-fold PLP-dependent enzyme [Alphaproteobacteria bacterium]